MAKVTVAKKSAKASGKLLGKTLNKMLRKGGSGLGTRASLAKVSPSQKEDEKKKSRRGERLELPKELLLKMHGLMVKSRALEERLIKVYRAGDSFFWIGGPGEEAFGVPLGLLIHKGQGPEYDMLHLHYRCTPTLIAMGMTMEDALRLMMNRSTDPSTGGRNFCNHYCFPQWNVLPVSSPIEVQYGMAIGTAMAQRRRHLQAAAGTTAGTMGESVRRATSMKGSEGFGTKGISIVTGGDAGTAEGDFASCLVWSSRPGFELPIFITVQNNKWGISTTFDAQHGEKYIADRGKAFGIRTAVFNGNDPIESYLGIQTEMDYIRRTGKPVLAEFRVSRLYGHSSATGGNREVDVDPIELFEKKLVDNKVLSLDAAKVIWKNYEDEGRRAADVIRQEPVPTADSIWDHTYVNNENADWRKF